MKIPTRIALAAAAVLATAGPALAGTIYKYERPDGTFVYSDAPVKGARLVERFTMAEGSPPPAPAPRVQAPAPDRGDALDAADAEVRAAQRAVDDAKARLEQGAEPLPGERAGTAGGKSRLTEDYFARQQELKQQLEDADARLEAAYRRRNEAR
jgi:Domain of unknown function (DUF4124)